MGFEGWLLKINGAVFPTKLISFSSLKITPYQIMDLDPYRDGNGELHRNVLPHTATSIEFTTTYLKLKDAEILNSFLPHGNRVRCMVDYWNPNASRYDSGAFYITDIPYEFEYVSEERRDILYKPIKITITEY